MNHNLQSNAKVACGLHTMRVVILGAGFGGVFAAKELAKRAPAEVSIELISERNYFTFQPLLPEVAGGVLAAQDAVAPVRLLLPKRVQFHQAIAKKIDEEGKKVVVVQGQQHRLIDVPYDRLILATGCVPNTAIVPGFSEHAFTLKTLADAFDIRNHILQCLEWADATKNPDIKKRLLTFVVVGAGFSGVELVGEIQDMIRRCVAHFPRIDATSIRICVVQRGDRVLPELSPSLSDYTKGELERRGVEVLTQSGVAAVSRTAVTLADGTVVPTATVVTTAGNKPTAVVTDLEVTKANRGRLKTDIFLRVESMNNTWALGDAALVPRAKGSDDFCPPTAQFATRQAVFAARNVIASIVGKNMNEWSFTPKGSLASLGGYRGVGSAYGIPLRGVMGWAVWRGFYMMKLPGFVTKLRVALNWFLDYFIPRNIVELENSSSNAVHFLRFAGGDILYEKGELLDAWHVVVEGQVEITRLIDEKMVTVELGPGESFGNHVNGFGELARGSIKAIENTRVMVIGWQDFQSIRDSSPDLNKFFTDASKRRDELFEKARTASSHISKEGPSQ